MEGRTQPEEDMEEEKKKEQLYGNRSHERADPPHWHSGTTTSEAVLWSQKQCARQ
jgi:hypothetical protein